MFSRNAFKLLIRNQGLFKYEDKTVYVLLILDNISLMFGVSVELGYTAKV